VNVGVRVARRLDHGTIVLSGPFGLVHAAEVVKSWMLCKAPRHIWMVAIRPTSAWHRSIELTGPAQPCWRGYSIVWPQTGVRPTSPEATTPRRRDFYRSIANIEPLSPLLRHAA
jgi:hypothetical protein